MQNPILFGFVLMMSGAVLGYLTLPNRQGQSRSLSARSGLVLIYPAIIVTLFAVGMAEIITTITAR
jgi:hypothetical protein